MKGSACAQKTGESFCAPRGDGFAGWHVGGMGKRSPRSLPVSQGPTGLTTGKLRGLRLPMPPNPGENWGSKAPQFSGTPEFLPFAVAHDKAAAACYIRMVTKRV